MFPGTAYMFKHSLITYDGKAVLQPVYLIQPPSKCKFLLTRDFAQKMFTVYLSQGNVTMQFIDADVVISIDRPRVRTNIPSSHLW